MTIEQAIKHYREEAEELRETAKSYPNYEPYDKDHCACLECAREHEQLAEWLRQLKRLKEAYESDYQIDDLIQVCLDIWG